MTYSGPPGKDTRARQVAAAAQRELVEFELPSWLRTIGVGSWLGLGVAAAVALVLLALGLVGEVMIPLAIAAVLAAVLVPLADRLERMHVPRWLAATLVLVLSLSIAAATVALVVKGITTQSDEIWQRIEASLQQLNVDLGGTAGGAGPLIDSARRAVRLLASGALLSLVGSAGALIVSTVLAMFILLYLLKDWNQVVGWTAGHLGVPAPVGRRILDGAVTAFRGYASGLTLIGAVNAAVVAIGAWLLGVPLVGTIAIVSFVTSYVPYLGAFVAGAFAVLIAYGADGFGTAIAMLAIVVLANNTIQNLIEPAAFGKRLRLHPLAVLITVTSATVLFGVAGAVLAAPLTSAAANAAHELRGVAPPLDDGTAGARGLNGPPERL